MDEYLLKGKDFRPAASKEEGDRMSGVEIGIFFSKIEAEI